MKSELKKFFKSFTYAAAGIVRCLRERNMRFHICAAVTVMGMSFFYGLTRAELCLLLLCIGLVMTAEAVNTAIEAAVDLVSDNKPSPLAKAAKDCAAGAVLISACISAAIGIIIFGDKVKIAEIIGYYADNPPAVIGLAAWGCFCLIFIFAFGKGSKQ